MQTFPVSLVFICDLDSRSVWISVPEFMKLNDSCLNKCSLSPFYIAHIQHYTWNTVVEFNFCLRCSGIWRLIVKSFPGHKVVSDVSQTLPGRRGETFSHLSSSFSLFVFSDREVPKTFDFELIRDGNLSHVIFETFYVSPGVLFLFFCQILILHSFPSLTLFSSVSPFVSPLFVSKDGQGNKFVSFFTVIVMTGRRGWNGPSAWL